MKEALSNESAINVDEYVFEPIKGFPMLQWRGKRPFTSTQFFPAQLKEVHGTELDGWRNKIYWGDNLQVLSHLLKRYRGKIHLIYIDPPFDSKADYKKKIKLKSKNVSNDHSAFEEKQYSDIWINDEYLQFMYERIILARELLADNGSIFLHCDDSKNSHLRMILDEVFGIENFNNEIIWKRSTSTGLSSKRCGTLHDTIYWYSKSRDYKFNMQYHEHDEKYLKRAREDENGRMYIPIPTGNPGPRPNLYYEYKGYWPHENGYKWKKEKIEEFDKAGLLIFPENKDGRIQLKQYLDESKGVKLQDLWLDIPAVNPVAKERNGYPTQKPESLLNRIVSMASDPGDIVLDFFIGSGTTAASAQKLGRRFIGADINSGAIQISTKRLVDDLNQLGEDCCGFEIYNVNNYDIFRNPVQARELLMEALEIQPIDNNASFDGEKDGRLVKLMPVNKIATKADLAPLVSSIPYKSWERRQNDNPNKPVEKILLVCMGHEPDLKANLELELKPFLVDIEVVDVLKDRTELEFRRDAEADVAIQGNELIIKSFYPMNLLQKLSIQKTEVTDWKELADSVMIDWNYDGAIFQPKLIDIPEPEDFVKGAYEVPNDAGTIRVKITDLLSETWERTING